MQGEACAHHRVDDRGALVGRPRGRCAPAGQGTGDQPRNTVLLPVLDDFGDGRALCGQPVDPRRFSAELGTCEALGHRDLGIKAVGTCRGVEPEDEGVGMPNFYLLPGIAPVTLSQLVDQVGQSHICLCEAALSGSYQAPGDGAGKRRPVASLARAPEAP